MEAWFETARMGLFIHWSHSSQRGIEVSWPLVGGVGNLPDAPQISVEDYHRTAETFDPRAYDPATWARLAKRCGAQYAVLTAKHHDGYALWDTKTSSYGVMHSPFGRDIVREYVEAFRAEGVRPGLYFSLVDWHHADYPPFRQEDAPYRFPSGRPLDPERWPRFVDVMFEQVRELLTDYGEIAVLWFDGYWERTADQWRASELRALIRSLQPHAIVNDRLPGQGDFLTPEQFVPAKPPDRPWETCLTMNESWAYNPADTRYKSPRELVHTVCEVAGRGGNLLLNVGPRGDGTLAPEQEERLDAIAGWMGRCGASIIGTEAGLEPWQCYGPSTRRGDTVYLHLLMRPYDGVTVRGVRTKRLRSATVLATGEPLRWRARTMIADTLYNPDPVGEVTIAVPETALDAYATVIALDFAPGVAAT